LTSYTNPKEQRKGEAAFGFCAAKDEHRHDQKGSRMDERDTSCKASISSRFHVVTALATAPCRVLQGFQKTIRQKMLAFRLAHYEIVYNELFSDYCKSWHGKGATLAILATHGVAIWSAVPFSNVARDIMNDLAQMNGTAMGHDMARFMLLTAGATVLNAARSKISKNAGVSATTSAKKNLVRSIIELRKRGVDTEYLQPGQRLTDIEALVQSATQLGLGSMASIISLIQFGIMLYLLCPTLLGITIAYCALDNWLTHIFTRGLEALSNAEASLQDKCRVEIQFLARSGEAEVERLFKLFDGLNRIGRKKATIAAIQDCLTTIIERGAQIYPLIFGTQAYFAFSSRTNLGIVQQQGEVARGFLSASALYRTERNMFNQLLCAMQRLCACLKGKLPVEETTELPLEMIVGAQQKRRSLVSKIRRDLFPWGNLPEMSTTAVASSGRSRYVER